MENDLISIIRLIRSENVGLKTFWQLISLYHTATNALTYIAELSLRGGRNLPIKIYSQELAEADINACKERGIKIISYLDCDFPELLKNIDDCPPLLYCLGNSKLLNGNNIAIVGARDASLNAIRFAYNLAKNLLEQKHVIVSGFARGIDSAAHKACIGQGTIAVLAGGIDHIYPPENEELYYQLIEHDLIVAELPLGSIPKSQNFPRRNRIISGISRAVAVIEAGLKSGSLITAKLALMQNRELFVVPGFPLDFRYQGNNYLLKGGAYLLEHADDIIEVLNNMKIKSSVTLMPNERFISEIKIGQKNEFSQKELTQARQELIKLVSTSPNSIDEIIAMINIAPEAILTAIVELELAGKVIRHYGNQISIKY